MINHMRLTKGEYSLFSSSSQKALLNEKGIAIAKMELNAKKEIRIYLIFDFFVEVLIHVESNSIESINLNVSGISEKYFEDG